MAATKKLMFVLMITLSYLMLGLSANAATLVPGSTDYRLPERTGFNPGNVVPLSTQTITPGAPNATVKVSFSEPNQYYAIILRAASLTNDQFNNLKVTIDGKFAGSYFPCTVTLTNAKLLFFIGTVGEHTISLDLAEGPGVKVENLRVYRADLAYRLKQLPTGSISSTFNLTYQAPSAAFKTLAINSAKYLEFRTGGLRDLIKEINRCQDQYTFLMLVRRYIEYLETPDFLLMHTPELTSFEAYRLFKNIQFLSTLAPTDIWRLELVNTLYYMARISYIDLTAYRVSRYYRVYKPNQPAAFSKLGLTFAPYQFPKETDLAAKIPQLMEFDKTFPILPHNHQTWPALSLSYAVDYFSPYGLQEANVWKTLVEMTFGSALTQSKPNEDSQGYDLSSILTWAEYAQKTGNKTFFGDVNSPLSQFIDRQIISTNNKGDGSRHGDIGAFSTGPYWTMAHLQPGNVVSTMIQKSPIPMPESFRSAMLTAKTPSKYIGVNVLQLPDLWYNYYNTISPVASNLQPGQRFDKISFRKGFTVDDSYLLLDGISNGGHGHMDANTILDFSENNRFWIVDGGYKELKIKEMQHHNGVFVSRAEVQSGAPSPDDTLSTFAGIDGYADFNNTAFTKTTMNPNNGTDWTRFIFWLKGSFFFVVDQVDNNQSSTANVTCQYRTLGKYTSNGAKISIEQGPVPGLVTTDQRTAVFNLFHLDSSAVSVEAEPDAQINTYYKGYAFASPVVNRIKEKVVLDSVTKQHHFMNLFHSYIVEKNPNITAAKASEKSIKVNVGTMQYLLGVSKLSTAEYATDASMYIISKQMTSLMNATELTSNGKTVFKSEKPVSIEWNISTGNVRIKANEATTAQLTLPTGSFKLQIIPGDSKVLLVKSASGGVAKVVN